MLKKIRTYLFFLISLVTFFGCRDEVCTNALITDVNLNFYNFKSKAKSVDILTAYGIDRSDSLLYDSTINKSSISLPLDQESDESKFIMDFAIITDTLFFYDSIPYDSIIKVPIPDTIVKYKPDTTEVYIRESFIDTMVIHYTRKIQMVSAECGFVTIFELINIYSSHSAIDSVHLVMPVINIDSDEENVKIFF